MDAKGLRPMANGENGHENGAGNGSGRDEHGRWARGNPGGPGRAAGHAAVAARFRGVLLQELSDEDFAKMVRAQIKKAIRGDTRSYRLIADRLMGPVGQPVDTDAAEQLVVIFRRPEMRDDVQSSPIERVGATPPARA